MYTDTVMDHFRHPRNAGEIREASAVGEAANTRCGDVMRIYLAVNEQGIITDVGFRTSGCVAAIASSSMATVMIKGKSVEEALTVTNHAIERELGGLPPVKFYCSLLAEQAIRAAVADYRDKHPVRAE